MVTAKNDKVIWRGYSSNTPCCLKLVSVTEATLSEDMTSVEKTDKSLLFEVKDGDRVITVLNLSPHSAHELGNALVAESGKEPVNSSENGIGLRFGSWVNLDHRPLVDSYWVDCDGDIWWWTLKAGWMFRNNDGYIHFDLDDLYNGQPCDPSYHTKLMNDYGPFARIFKSEDVTLLENSSIKERFEIIESYIGKANRE